MTVSLVLYLCHNVVTVYFPSNSIDHWVLLSINRAILMYVFGMSLSAFAVISMLRNMAIRKPFYEIKTKIIYGVLLALNCESLVIGLVVIFTYHPKHTSYTTVFAGYTWTASF